jgi:tellurite resistance protein
MLPKTCPFFISWWSVSFPMAAVTISALHYAEGHPGAFQFILAGALLLTTTLVITYLIIQTLQRIIKGNLVTPVPAVSIHN